MMKRGILAAVMIGAALLVTGCKKNDNVISFDQYSQYKDIDTTQCVEVGPYKNLQIKETELKVSDTDLEKKISNVLYANGYYVDASEHSISVGNKIGISLTGYIDDKMIDGFTTDDYSFVYGDGEHIMDGFASHLEGMYAGESTSFDMEVPGTFTEEAYIGKTVTFHVYVNSVEAFVVPELNDEFVQKVSDCKTVDEYKEYLIPVIQKETLSLIQSNKKSGVWKIVSDASAVKEYPEQAIETMTERLTEQLGMYAMVNNMELEAYVKNFFGITFEEYVERAAKQELLLDAIGRMENITMTEKEYEEAATAYSRQIGYNSLSECYKVIGEDKVKQAMLWDKVMQFIADQAAIVTE